MKRLALLADEGGFALATAMAVLFIILTLGLVALQTVDFQSRSSSQETAGEAAFNLAESALDAETAQLGTQWPSASSPWTAACNQSTAPATGCPGTSLTSSFSSTYAGSQFKSPLWQLRVLDNTWNPNNDYYSDSLATSAPNYDANQDSKLWLRGQATIAGQTRVVVAEVVRDPHVLSLPRNVVTAGGMYTSNNGNKIIVNANDCVPNCGQSNSGTSGLSGQVALRCGTSTTAPSYGTLCAGWDADHGQLSPPSFTSGYTDATPGGQTLQPAQMQALKATAIANGTYYPAGQCPPAGTSGVVYVENANCTYNSNSTWNSDAAPGMLIFAKGTIYFSGTLNFYGIIYMADQEGPAGPPCSDSVLQNDYTINGGPVFSVHGTGTLYGALFVGNCGVVDAGSSAWNIQFDSNAFNGAQVYATPALAKNTFQIVAHP
jgi:Tfp pilus assembly protein PilX